MADRKESQGPRDWSSLASHCWRSSEGSTPDWSAGSLLFARLCGQRQAEIRKEKSRKNKERFCVSLYLLLLRAKKCLCAWVRIGPRFKSGNSQSRAKRVKNTRRGVS